MGVFDLFNKKKRIVKKSECDLDMDLVEFCPKCQATLTLQKGYSNELTYWICKGCGEMLTSPEVTIEDDISWICDDCEKLLNVQEGFSTDCSEWKCNNCGCINRICASEIYSSDDEYRAAINNPYRGMDDESVVEIMGYEEVENIVGRSDIVLVKDREKNELYVKKILKTYDLLVYKYLKDHPVPNMPKIYGIYEGLKRLIIIEEYIEGKTVEKLLKDNYFDRDKAIAVTKKLCIILEKLHNLDKPIIHRDIKPSNIMITSDGQVYLLDVNVAKMYNADENEDTRFLGTMYYAAPEQLGYGFTASSEKTDVYALGVLLNVMITGKIPKEKKAEGEIWNVIEKCISLNIDDRYTDKELLYELERIQ